MAGSDDLATLFAAEPAPVLRGGQGQLLQFNPDTFENRVLWRGSTLTNVSISAGVDALSLSVGDVVILAGFSSTDGGASSWWIIGRASIPPLADPVRIIGGDLIVEGGGSFTARDGSAIRALYADGSTAVVWGSLVIEGTDTDSGHGLLAQDIGDGPDVFRAVRRPDGIREVINGATAAEGPLDAFWVFSDLIQIGSTTTPADEIRIRSDDIIMGMPDPGGSRVSLPPTGDAFLIAGNGAVSLVSSTSQVFASHATVGSDDNCVISSVGLIRRVASSRRYKTDIKDLSVNPAIVLDLKPRTWRDKSDVAADPDTDRWHVGLIAEEVEDAGLGAFVNYDEQGRPDSIQYDRLAVPLLELCREQQAQIDALTDWASSQGFQPPERPSVEATLLPKRKPSRAAPGRPDLSASDRPVDRSGPRS